MPPLKSVTSWLQLVQPVCRIPRCHPILPPPRSGSRFPRSEASPPPVSRNTTTQHRVELPHSGRPYCARAYPTRSDVTAPVLRWGTVVLLRVVGPLPPLSSTLPKRGPIPLAEPLPSTRAQPALTAPGSALPSLVRLRWAIPSILAPAQRSVAPMSNPRSGSASRSQVPDSRKSRATPVACPASRRMTDARRPEGSEILHSPQGPSAACGPDSPPRLPSDAQMLNRAPRAAEKAMSPAQRFGVQQSCPSTSESLDHLVHVRAKESGMPSSA